VAETPSALHRLEYERRGLARLASDMVLARANPPRMILVNAMVRGGILSGQRVGYVRVSSFDQNPERQLDNISLEKTFTDKASGKGCAARIPPTA
jgi:hypothetical protein